MKPFFVVLILMGSFHAIIESQTFASEIKVTDRELSVAVAVSNDPEYIDEWVNTPPNHDVHITVADHVKSYQTVYVSLIVSGFDVDVNKATNLIGSITVTDPNGQTILSQHDQYRHHKVLFSKKVLVMLEPALDFTWEPSDLTGKYSFSGTVIDQVTKKMATDEHSVVFN